MPTFLLRGKCFRNRATLLRACSGYAHKASGQTVAVGMSASGVLADKAINAANNLEKTGVSLSSLIDLG
jgi:hypothetical protein